MKVEELVAWREAQRRELAAALESKRERQDAEAVLVLDGHGELVLAVPPGAQPTAGERHAARRALGTAEALLDEGTGHDDVAVAVAVDPAAREAGALVARYDTSRAVSAMVLRWPHPPEIARRMVFLTGGAFSPGARKLIDDHRTRCIEKPFDPEELRARVAEAVQRLALA